MKHETKWAKFSDFIDDREYLKCYVWLTTSSLNNIEVNGKLLAGFDTVIAEFKKHIPSDLSPVIKETYWDNYTWICKTYLYESDPSELKGSPRFYTILRQEYYHFKMLNESDEIFPPIPMFLVDLYLMCNDAPQLIKNKKPEKGGHNG